MARSNTHRAENHGERAGPITAVAVMGLVALAAVGGNKLDRDPDSFHTKHDPLLVETVVDQPPVDLVDASNPK